MTPQQKISIFHKTHNIYRNYEKSREFCPSIYTVDVNNRTKHNLFQPLLEPFRTNIRIGSNIKVRENM